MILPVLLNWCPWTSGQNFTIHKSYELCSVMFSSLVSYLGGPQFESWLTFLMVPGIILMYASLTIFYILPNSQFIVTHPFSHLSLYDFCRHGTLSVTSFICDIAWIGLPHSNLYVCHCSPVWKNRHKCHMLSIAMSAPADVGLNPDNKG